MAKDRRFHAVISSSSTVMTFKRIPLNDGNSIVPIAFGTGSSLFGQDVTAYVLQALEAGFLHIDTAKIYRTEGGVGTAVVKSKVDREKLYITTKFDGGNVREEFESSLRFLGMDYVDLYLIHFPGFVEGKVEQSWRAMEQIQREGLAKSIGISNYSIAQMKQLLRIARIKPAVNQIRFHPYNWAENKPLLEFAKAHDIVIESYSGLTPITKMPGGPLDPVLDKLARRRDATPAQILMLWVQSKGVVIVTTTSKKQRLKEYLDIQKLEPLSKGELAEIDAAGIKGGALNLN